MVHEAPEAVVSGLEESELARTRDEALRKLAKEVCKDLEKQSTDVDSLGPEVLERI